MPFFFLPLSVNDIYSLDLLTMNWKVESVSGEKPKPRYGHSQVYIDDTHMMIMGTRTFISLLPLMKVK